MKKEIVSVMRCSCYLFVAFVLIIVSVFHIQPCLACNLLADSVQDFSDVQGQKGWYYGYYDGSSATPFSPSDFKELTIYDDHAEGSWHLQLGPGGFWTSLSDIGGHPNGPITSGDRQPTKHWAVRRWISNFNGLTRISGNIHKVNTAGGDGVTGYIFVDGSEIFVQSINGTDGVGSDFTLSANVNVGSIIDFAIDTKEEDCHHGTYFTAKIF